MSSTDDTNSEGSSPVVPEFDPEEYKRLARSFPEFDPEEYQRLGCSVPVVNNDLTSAFAELDRQNVKREAATQNFASLEVVVPPRDLDADVAALVALSPEVNASAARTLLANANPKFSDAQHATFSALVVATCNVLNALDSKMAALGDDPHPAAMHATVWRPRRSGKTRLLCALAARLLCNTGPAFARARRLSVVTHSRDHARVIVQYILEEVWRQSSGVELLAFAPADADYFARFTCPSSGRTCTVVGADSEAFENTGLANTNLVLVDDPSVLPEEAREQINALQLPRISISTEN